jgi:hypothetical protein
VGLEDSSRFGASLLSIRSGAPLTRAVPIEAVAEVVSERERRISVRVELVAAEPAPAPAAPKSLPSASRTSLESEAAQLTAASTAAALARSRGLGAYAASRDLLDGVALARGVCVRVDA